MKKNKKICFIASSGGHLEEICQLKKVIDMYDNYFVVTDTLATKKSSKYKYRISDFDRTNKIRFLIHFISMFLEQMKIFVKEKPDIIITTGAGLVIPTCLIAKILKKKIIYIESFARVSTPSKTGKFIYKICDLFIIQREDLKQFYPKAINGGEIF